MSRNLLDPQEKPLSEGSATDFRQLLEALAPLESLAQAERIWARRALSAAIAEPLTEAGKLTLARLGIAWDPEPSVQRRVEPAHGRAEPELGATGEQSGVLRFPRAALPGQARGGLDRAHRLLTLDDPFLSSDPRGPNARLGLIQQLSQVGRDVLGATDLRFVPATEGNGPDAPSILDRVLLRHARANPGFVYYCPDASAVPGLGPGTRRREVRSLAVTAVLSSEAKPLGLLEVGSVRKDAFGTEELALVALLADTFAAVLERVSRIEKLVFIDPMTAAYNRSYFELEVQNEMARATRESRSMGLCIVDIDDFKSFNDRFGYEGGNQVLVHVAQSLKGAVRPFDTVARWGGEEFAVLLTAPVQAQDVVTVSERLRSMVERQEVSIRDLEGGIRPVGVTVSIGVALFPDDETDAEGLWRAANRALLVAKRPPKNQVVFYHTLRQPGRRESD